MPTKEELTEDMILAYKKYVEEAVGCYNKYKCKTTIQMLLIQLFESSQAIASSEHGSKMSNLNYLKDEIPDSWLKFNNLRQDLTHNPHKVGVGNDFFKHILDEMSKIGKDDLNRLFSICGVDKDMYKSIYNYCESQVLLDPKFD